MVRSVGVGQVVSSVSRAKGCVSQRVPCFCDTIKRKSHLGMELNHGQDRLHVLCVLVCRRRRPKTGTLHTKKYFPPAKRRWSATRSHEPQSGGKQTSEATTSARKPTDLSDAAVKNRVIPPASNGGIHSSADSFRNFLTEDMGTSSLRTVFTLSPPCSCGTCSDTINACTSIRSSRR